MFIIKFKDGTEHMSSDILHSIHATTGCIDFLDDYADIRYVSSIDYIDKIVRYFPN